MIRQLPAALTAGQVARMLGYSRSWFYHNRDRLEAAGFPGRIGPTQRWSRQQVEEWINSGGITSFNTTPEPATPSATTDTGGNVQDFTAWAEIARKRNRRDFPDAAG